LLRRDAMGKGLVVVLSGPSCAGKTPLLLAIEKLYPDLHFARPVPYTCRPPRPGEPIGRDFHFTTEDEIRSMPPDRFLVGKVRATWQAVDMLEVAGLLENNRRVVFELYYELAARLMAHPAVVGRLGDFSVRTVFIAPVSDDELAAMLAHNPRLTERDLLSEISRIRQTTRAMRQGKKFTDAERADIQARAATVWDEMQAGKQFTDYIVNHDGEDSTNWDFTPPPGDAGRLVRTFASILRDCG